MRNFANLQFIKYILIGTGNTLFSYGAYALFLFSGIQFQIANLLALVLGIGFSFTTQGNIVFKNATRVTFIKFVLAWLVIYLFNIAIITVLMRVSLSAYMAGALATLPVTIASYFILKYVVFKREGTVPEKP